MKKIEYYSEVSAPFPNKYALTTTFWYKGGAVFAKKLPGWDTPRQARGDFTLAADGQYLKTLPKDSVVDEVEYKRLQAAYYAEKNRLGAEFKADALDFVCLGEDPARDVIYAEAYDRGHAHGYSEVLNCLESLASFINSVDNARTAAKLP